MSIQFNFRGAEIILYSRVNFYFYSGAQSAVSLMIVKTGWVAQNHLNFRKGKTMIDSTAATSNQHPTPLECAKALRFAQLHQNGPFILANVWDAGTAQLMAALGAKALATSSAAHAFTLGRPDGGQLRRDEAIAHAVDINHATALPVNADLENGFGDDLEDVKSTVRQSIESGLAGCGIEDIQFPTHTPYEFDASVQRIEAAVDAKKSTCRALDMTFTLTARADGVMIGKYGLDEALRRIKAFERAGLM